MSDSNSSSFLKWFGGILGAVIAALVVWLITTSPWNEKMEITNTTNSDIQFIIYYREGNSYPDHIAPGETKRLRLNEDCEIALPNDIPDHHPKLLKNAKYDLYYDGNSKMIKIQLQK